MFEKYRDHGLLLLRIGIGVMFVLHGWPKVAGGPEFWAKIGGAMGNFGIGFAPTFWGLMAALAEFGGGILLALGLFARPAAASMAFTMLVATTVHLSMGEGFKGASHAMELGIVFLALVFVGPGRLSLDAFRARRSHAATLAAHGA